MLPTALHGGTHLLLVIKVCDEAVGVVVVALVEREELGKVVPITIVLVAHVVTNTAGDI